LVTKAGAVRADGRAITIEELGKKFAELARANGYIFYFREDPGASEPHPNAMQVMALIVEHGLPVRFAAGPDFTHAVDLGGAAPEGDD
jgi:hypothetical protein